MQFKQHANQRSSRSSRAGELRTIVSFFSGPAPSWHLNIEDSGEDNEGEGEEEGDSDGAGGGGDGGGDGDGNGDGDGDGGGNGNDKGGGGGGGRGGGGGGNSNSNGKEREEDATTAASTKYGDKPFKREDEERKDEEREDEERKAAEHELVEREASRSTRHSLRHSPRSASAPLLAPISGAGTIIRGRGARGRAGAGGLSTSMRAHPLLSQASTSAGWWLSVLSFVYICVPR